MDSLLDQTNQLTVELDPNKNYFEELVGEGKKYKDQEALAKSRLFADEHIKNLETEKAQLLDDHLRLREEYNKALNLQELLDRLKEQQSTDGHTQQTMEQEKHLTVNDIESLLETRENKKREESNFQTVQRKLMEHYGSGYSQQLKTQAESLGMSAQEVDTMARTNPKAFERLFLSAPQTETFDAPPSSTRRSTTFAPQTNKRGWKYYEKLKAEQPDVYWLPKTQLQMHADAKALGDAFDD